MRGRKTAASLIGPRAELAPECFSKLFVTVAEGEREYLSDTFPILWAHSAFKFALFSFVKARFEQWKSIAVAAEYLLRHKRFLFRNSNTLLFAGPVSSVLFGPNARQNICSPRQPRPIRHHLS